MEENSPSEDRIDADSLRRLRLEELRLLQRKLATVKGRALELYKPQAKQDVFHRAEARFRAYFGGNRSGKSTAGICEDCAYLLGYRPWIPEGDPGRRSGIPQRPVKLLVLTTDWEKVNEIFTEIRGEGQGKFWKFIPPERVRSFTRNKGSGVIQYIELDNGSTIAFDTVKAFLNNAQSVESSDHDAIHVDEPIPEQMWVGASRGLIDRGGRAWFTLTPLEEPWIYDKFHTGKPNHWSARVTMRENIYLAQQSVDEFEADLTPEEKECRINGVPLEHAGIIYKEFKYERHVLTDPPTGWSCFNDPPRDTRNEDGVEVPTDYTYFIYIDYHPHTPHAVSFYCVPPSGYPLFQWDEIYVHCTVRELCELMDEKMRGRPIGWCRIDPSAFIDNPVSGDNAATEFHKYGYFVEKATKALSQGILRVKDVLKNTPTQIYFAPNLIETLREFGRYRWGFEKGRPTNKPHDADDHMMENLYRFLLDEPIPMPQTKLEPVELAYEKVTLSMR